MKQDGNKIIDILSREWAQTAMDSKKRLAILTEENDRLYAENEELKKENQQLKQAIADNDKKHKESDNAE